MAFEDMAGLVEDFKPKAALACKDAALAAMANDAVSYLQARRRFRIEIVRDQT